MNTGKWPQWQDDLLREMYGTRTGVREMAERLDRTAISVYRRAEQLGLKREGQSVIGLCRRGAQRPQGVAVCEITGVNSNTVGSAMAVLARNGEVFVAKVGHRTVRYFDTKERADAYVAVAPKPKPHAKPALRLRPGWGPSDPCVITSETKVTIAPPPQRALRTNTYSVW